jgi:hypothetical protein
MLKQFVLLHGAPPLVTFCVKHFDMDMSYGWDIQCKT